MINYDKDKVFFWLEINKDSLLARIKCTVRYILRCSLRKQLINDIDLSKDNIFFMSDKRSDYIGFFNEVYNQCNYSKGILEITRIKTINLSNYILLIKNIKLLFKINKKELLKIAKECLELDLSRVKFGLLEKLYIYSNLISLFEFESLIDNLKCKRNIIVFADTKPLEGVLVKKANSKGINTITMQHAIFSDNLNLQSVNILNYLNVPSKNILVWGTMTKALFLKYNPKLNIHVLGNPILRNIEKAIKENTIGIVLDIPEMFAYNQKLIDIVCNIAIEHNKVIIIRKHPADIKNKYVINYNNILFNKNLDEAYFIVGHTSTMVFTYLSQGCKVLQYRSDLIYNRLSESLTFENIKELRSKIKNIESLDFSNAVKRDITYIGEESKILYKQFFDKINEI